ncbi:hypothetical protein D3C75_407710 [compost metagenome]
MERHPPRGRSANQPIATQAHQERGLGILEPANAAHGNGLRAVEQLEPSRHRQQAHGEVDDIAERRVVMVEKQTDQLIRQQPEDHGETQHRRRPERNADPPGQPRIQQLPGAVVLADAHGDGIRNTRWDHERHRNDLQGDLVCTQLRAAHGAHAQRGEGKQPDFHRVGAANRQAQTPQLLQVLAVQPRQALAQRIGLISRMPTNVPRQRKCHQVGDNRRDQPDARQPQFRQAEHAGNQRIVEQEVGDRTANTDDHHWRCTANGAGEPAQGHEAQVAGQGERQEDQKLPGCVDVAFSLAEQQQHRFEVPQQQTGDQRHQPRQPQPGLGQSSGPDNIAGTLTDRHQGADRRNHADAENRHERIGRRTEPATGQGLGTQARHHQSVGEDHQHVRQLRGNQRPRQPQDGPEFSTCWMLHGHHARLSKGNRKAPILGALHGFHKGIKRMDSMIQTHAGEFLLG